MYAQQELIIQVPDGADNLQAVIEQAKKDLIATVKAPEEHIVDHTMVMGPYLERIVTLTLHPKPKARITKRGDIYVGIADWY